MIQKIGYFHSFALNTSRASGDIVSSRDREKKIHLGAGEWQGEEGRRERCVLAALQQRAKGIPTFGLLPWSRVGSRSCHLPALPVAFCP